MSVIRFYLLLGVLLYSAQHIFAKNYYVDAANGNDANTGLSTTSAWKTLSKVNNAAFIPGDNILFKRGAIFTGSFVVHNDGTASSPITFGAYGSGNRPIIDGTGQQVAVRLDHRKYVNLKDINIRNASYGISFMDVQNILIDNILIDNCAMGGFGDQARNCIVRNSTIQNSTTSHGLYFGFGCYLTIIENNTFCNNKKSGIHFNCDANANPSRNITVRYNRIYGNQMYGIMNTATRNSEFYYNLVYNNTGYGMEFEYDIHASGNATDSNRVYNNVFYNTLDGPSLYIGSQMKGNVVRNNIFYQGSQTYAVVNDKSPGGANTFSNNLYFGSTNGSLWYKGGNIYSSYSQWAAASGEQNSMGGTQAQYDPQFNNISYKDFSLKSVSPAIGKGIYVGITRDILGSIIPSLNPDLGAYQRGGTILDITRPAVVSASAYSSTLVVLIFSEKVNATDAINKSNYTINNGITVYGATIASDGISVTLTTSQNVQGRTNTVLVNNVKDLAGNVILSTANSAQYTLAVQNSTPVKLTIVKATAASSFYSTNGPDKTIDGLSYSQDPNSTWTGKTFPAYLIFDLGSLKTVTQTKFSFYGFNTGRIYNYSVAVSIDGQAWSTVIANKSSLPQEWTVNNITQQQARYVKLIFNSANNTNLWATFYEAEIWGLNQLAKDNIGTDILNTVPEQFSLNQNYPNPFNPSTQIKFSIPHEDHVTLIVYDILGKEVANLVNENMQPGNFAVSFNGSQLASGVYIYRLKGGNFVETRKMILQK